MLEHLKLKNFVLMKQAEIPFGPGLNIISGETGAGKSIVIDAIALLLGSRATSDFIRTGSDEAVIEGLFNTSQIAWIAERLERFGFSAHSSTLLIKRIIHRNGRHRIYVNGELATLNILKNLCQGLVDLCGQNEHQSLLKAQAQMQMLDQYGSLADRRRKVEQIYSTRRSLQNELEVLLGDQLERERKKEFLKFQLDELEQAELQPNEDEELSQKKRLLQSEQKRFQLAAGIQEIFEGNGSRGAQELLQKILSQVSDLAELDESAKPWAESVDRAICQLEDIDLEISRYLSQSSDETHDLEEIDARLDQIAKLKRKYGQNVSDILEFLEQLQKDWKAFEDSESRAQEVEKELDQVGTRLFEKGSKLSAQRKKFAKVFADSVTAELQDLKMGRAKFEVQLKFDKDILRWSKELAGDQIEYQICPNPGEATQSLAKIASGGELSRIMLAIRRVISDRGGIGVYLFDEIDAGIGGQTAFQVGKKLSSVAQFNQVICITHLPQVASFANHHISVSKNSSRDRTTAQATVVTKKQRHEELARMLGGPKLTSASLKNAKELLEQAQSHV